MSNYILNFTDPKKSQIKSMFDNFFPDQESNFKSIYSFIANRKVSMALMQKFFFDNIDSNDISTKKDELDKLIAFYSEKDSNLYL